MTATALLARLDRLDSAGSAAEALAQVRRDSLEVGARRLVLAAHWVDLHPFDADAVGDGVPGRLRLGRSRARRAGADGTPDYDEFSADELAVLLGIHTFSAQALAADATNLRHRHPRLWARVVGCEVVDWVAIKTAREVAAAGLTQEQARWVDAVTSDFATTLTPSRYLALVEAKIIEADPESAEAKRVAAELERFVRAGRPGQHGLRTVIARAAAGDVSYLDAVLDRLAEILQLQGDTDPADVRRSKALGILANPIRAVQLLALADKPTHEPTPAELDLTAAIAAGFAEVDPKKLLPAATLYVHMSLAALTTGEGVARMEGVGPITIDQARDFLAHSHVTLKPVIDLAGGMPVDCYEVPASMAEIVKLRNPHEIFPWATLSSRTADSDHAIPYVPMDEGGPPGQTHPNKLGPLRRRHHRVKTHGQGWQHHQISPGVHLWRTPTGHWARVDNAGTHDLGTGELGSDISVMEQHFAALLGGIPV